MLKKDNDVKSFEHVTPIFTTSIQELVIWVSSFQGEKDQNKYPQKKLLYFVN